MYGQDYEGQHKGLGFFISGTPTEGLLIQQDAETPLDYAQQWGTKTRAQVLASYGVKPDSTFDWTGFSSGVQESTSSWVNWGMNIYNSIANPRPPATTTGTGTGTSQANIMGIPANLVYLGGAVLAGIVVLNMLKKK